MDYTCEMIRIVVSSTQEMLTILLLFIILIGRRFGAMIRSPCAIGKFIPSLSPSPSGSEEGSRFPALIFWDGNERW